MGSLHVTADWSRFVDESDPEARFVVAPDDVDRLGLRAALDAYQAPPAPEPPKATQPPDKRRKFPDPT